MWHGRFFFGYIISSLFYYHSAQVDGWRYSKLWGSNSMPKTKKPQWYTSRCWWLNGYSLHSIHFWHCHCLATSHYLCISMGKNNINNGKVRVHKRNEAEWRPTLRWGWGGGRILSHKTCTTCWICLKPNQIQTKAKKTHSIYGKAKEIPCNKNYEIHH